MTYRMLRARLYYCGRYTLLLDRSDASLRQAPDPGPRNTRFTCSHMHKCSDVHSIHRAVIFVYIVPGPRRSLRQLGDNPPTNDVQVDQ
jgi:hypothetical protein